jgi:hypothetical protein
VGSCFHTSVCFVCYEFERARWWRVAVFFRVCEIYIFQKTTTHFCLHRFDALVLIRSSLPSLPAGRQGYEVTKQSLLSYTSHLLQFISAAAECHLSPKAAERKTGSDHFTSFSPLTNDYLMFVADKVAAVADKVALVAGEIAPVASKVAPVAGEVALVASMVAPVAGEVALVAGKVAAVADKVALVAGKVARVAGKVAHVAGKVALIESEIAA